MPTPADSRYKGGLLVWVIVTVVVAVPELIAAFTHNSDHLWRTISKTTGHLEARWWWVDLLVVGIIAVVALHAVVNPPVPADAASGCTREPRGLRRTPGGRVTLVERTEPLIGPREVSWPFTFAYLAASAAIVIGVSLWVSSRPRSGYGLEVTLYGSIAILFIILPSIAAACRIWVTPFTSFFATVVRIQRAAPLFGSFLLAGLAVLLIHLSLYPWPTRCYVGDQQVKKNLATATTPEQALGIIKPDLVRNDACFKP